MPSLLPIMISALLGIAVLLLSSAIASIVLYLRKAQKIGIPEATATQLSNILISLLIAYLGFHNMKMLGDLYLPLIQTLQSIPLAIAIVFVTYLIDRVFNGHKYAPFTISTSPITACILLLVIAPIGEELVFRGLIEGYLITAQTPLLITVLIPAILFSLAHLPTYCLVPEEKPPALYIASVLVVTLAVGILTGYYRAVTESIILPILLHSITNTNAIISYVLSSRISAQ